MTGKERTVMKGAFLKILSMAVMAAALAGMYGMRAHGAPGTDASYREEGPSVLISQFYGAGENRGVFSNDYVELYNPGAEEVSLDGYILSYSSGREEGKEGSTIDSDGVRREKQTELYGTIPAGGHYLICGGENSCGEEAYQISRFDRLWEDLVIDDQATVTLKLYCGSTLEDMLSTEGSACRYMVSADTAVVNPRSDASRRGESIRTFYWGQPVSEAYKEIYQPYSSFGAADEKKTDL